MSQTPLFSNILVRVPNWLGDTMMATPAVSAVRSAFPQARLTILCKSNFASFWKNFPGVDGVIELEKGFLGFWNTVEKVRGQNFDAALTLPSSFSSAFLLFAAGVPHRAGWASEGRSFCLTQPVEPREERQKHLVWEYLELVREGFGQALGADTFALTAPVEKEAKEQARALLEELGVDAGKGLIALGPGATYGPAKRWPLTGWKELIGQFLAERPETLLVLGGPEETTYLEDLFSGNKTTRLFSLAGKTTPPVLAAILAQCQLLITNDTGPMHVAAAVGTPTVALFGSTSPIWTRPFGTGHTVIYKNEECSPCFQKSCPIGYGCLNRITVDEVFEAVKDRLRAGARVTGEQVPQGVTL